MERTPSPGAEGVDRALDAGAFVASAVPVIGGPLSNIMTGIAQGRRLDRVKALVISLARRLGQLEKQADATYIAGEDFEELLEETLHRASRERDEAKRSLYRDFLLGQLVGPRSPYDEQLECLRLLEVLQIDHIRVLRALTMAPGQSPRYIGSPGDTLRRRLPGMPEATLHACVEDLARFDLAHISLHLMMTPDGAERLGHALTPLGRRFVGFLRTADV